jgi:hypothetical protein
LTPALAVIGTNFASIAPMAVRKASAFAKALQGHARTGLIVEPAVLALEHAEYAGAQGMAPAGSARGNGD